MSKQRPINKFHNVFYWNALDLISEEVRKFDNSLFDLLPESTKSLEGYYKTIPYKVMASEMISVLEELKQHSIVNKENPKFIDAGCGIGQVVAMANTVGFDAYGIDISNRAIDTAKRLFGGDLHSRFAVEQKNIFSHNFSGYDVIYFYRPIANESLAVRFLEKISKEASPGCIVVSAGIWGIMSQDVFSIFKGFGYYNPSDSKIANGSYEIIYKKQPK